MFKSLAYRVVRPALLPAALVVLAGSAAAVDSRPFGQSVLEGYEFFEPELVISNSHVSLDEILPDLPQRQAWEDFLALRADGAEHERVHAFFDPRSGAATNVMGAFPLVPGRGVGNAVTLESLGARLGRAVDKVEAREVAEAVTAFIGEHRALLGIDPAQLGAVRAVQVSGELWQVSIPQEVNGVRVRDARLAATLNNGNLVLIGTETWGHVAVRTRPNIGAVQVLEAGFTYAGGRSLADVIVAEPRLEIVPVAPQEHLDGEAYAGPVGAGYRHRLVWTFRFQRGDELATWEPMVDAHSGAVIAFQDKTHYLNRSITGGVYPITNTGVCPTTQTCGIMQSGWPMPWSNTGFAAPDNFTNSAGVYSYTSGTAVTTLAGKSFVINDTCGAISASSAAGSINLGGTNGQHDCTTPGTGGAGNTAAARTSYYELNKIHELARGWLPANAWLQSSLTPVNVNINSTCVGSWNGSQITVSRTNNGCANTGELAGVLAHEWGHGMDDNDVNGIISNSSEGYADIAANLHLQTSCLGHGLWLIDRGCGSAGDGTWNGSESQVGPAHCLTACSGPRDSDYLKHNPNTPDTALGYVCSSCSSSSGPCGRQVHCASAPQRQAAWNVAARDLPGPPFNYDSQTAFMVGNRLFYQGSGNIGTWYACTCGASSSGCGATNAYMQWLAADDDNGSVSDGTPRMTALYNAFNRHGIACSAPTPVNSGCAGAPTTAPTLGGTAGDHRAKLSWNAVTGATKYWVMRTEGHAGCNMGKARIAEVGGTSYVDSEVLAGRSYYYNVVAQGTSQACHTKVSNCVTVTPTTSGPARFAAYDSTFKAPRCALAGISCDSGALLVGRASLGPEANQPNTLAASACADGTSGVYHSDESNDGLKVRTLDGTNLASGKTAQIDASVWAWSGSPASDKLDLYYAADAGSPAWTYITTLTPTVAGAQVLSATYTLPAGTTQALRARFRYAGAAAACGTGVFDDHDDLVFAVQ